MRITHIVPDLETGGAETMLLKLVEKRASDFVHSVISLRSLGTIGPRLHSAGVEVLPLGWRGGRLPGARRLRNLIAGLKSLGPDVVQGWMYHGNLAATYCQAMLQAQPALSWSIRCSGDGVSNEGLLTRGVIWLGQMLSQRPVVTIYNSSRSREQHIARHFCSTNTDVVPNGFDLQRFRPDARRRASVRESLGVGDGEIVIGHVARVHPMKDQLSLLRAAAMLSTRAPDIRFVAVGRDMDRLAQVLPEAATSLEMLGPRVSLLPEQSDVAALMPGFDLFLLSSAWGEGFPNVLGEAMACGVPCVATDVGDCAEIIGDTGVVTAPSSPLELANAVDRILQLSTEARNALGLRARRRVEERYSIQQVVRNYESIWRTAAERQLIRSWINR